MVAGNSCWTTPDNNNDNNNDNHNDNNNDKRTAALVDPRA
jgi:hypothetical protein